ncbi:MAG: hypothetical protein IPJ41_13305 [Phycisphaerales bacterium]|nr:hypothetical protein [Phycisphaerales bacterium]
MGRSVLLRHDLPDGSHHFDWLIEPAGPGPGTGPEDRVLVAWRLPVPPGPGVELRAARLEPHRRLYLAYEGPVSGGRGSVRRIASGTGVILTDAPDCFEAEAALEGIRIHVRGRPGAEGGWVLGFDFVGCFDT